MVFAVLLFSRKGLCLGASLSYELDPSCRLNQAFLSSEGVGRVSEILNLPDGE